MNALDFPEDGHLVLRGAIPQDDVQQALRAINSRIFLDGLTREQSSMFRRTACWFPDLCETSHPWHPLIAKLRKPFTFPVGEVWTQIVLQFPDPPGIDGRTVGFHIDKPPADGRRYKLIVGVPLTPSDHAHGGILFKDEALELEPGDAVVFGGGVPHSGGVNRTGEIRYAVYFRIVV